MSPTPVPKRVFEPPRFQREKRSHSRYPIKLDLQYNVLKSGQIEHSGFGRTVNISSGGVLFETPDFPETKMSPDERRAVVLKMNRPLFMGDFALTLVMTGRIVRRSAGQIAVSIKHYEFRTGGSPRH